MRTLLSIARKDATVLVRDKAAVLVLIVMPFALIFILGSAFSGIESGDLDIPVAIVNEDDGAVGDEFVKGLKEAEGLDGLFAITVSDDAAEIRTRVEKGDLCAAMIIPHDTSKRIEAGEPVTIEMLQDPGSEVAAGVWVGVARAAVSYASAEIIVGRVVGEELAVRLDPAGAGDAGGIRPPLPPDGALDAVTVSRVDAQSDKELSMMSYYSAGMTAMFLLFGSMFGAFEFAKERRERTLDRMFVAPTNRTAIILGKGLGIIFVGVAQLALLLVGTSLVFGVEWGNVAAILVLGMAEVFAATGMAMALAAIGKTERAIGAAGPALILLFSATGGSMIPTDIMPLWLKPTQVVSPVYWTLSGFLKVLQGAGLADVAGYAGVVFCIGLALYIFGVWRLRY